MKIKNRFDRVLKMLTVFAMTLSCFTDMPIRVVAESFDVDSVISIESHNNGTDANDSEASLAVSVTVNGQTVTAPKSVAPGTLTVRANEGYEIDSMILDGTEFNESTDVQAGEHSLNITAHSTASQSNESEEIQQPDPTVEPTPTITPDPTPEVSEDPKATGTPETTLEPSATPEVTATPEISSTPTVTPEISSRSVANTLSNSKGFYIIEVGGTQSLKGESANSHRWESSNPAVATVSSNSRSATVKAVGEGTTTITHTYWNGIGIRTYDETWNIEVKSKEAPVESSDAYFYFLKPGMSAEPYVATNYFYRGLGKVSLTDPKLSSNNGKTITSGVTDYVLNYPSDVYGTITYEGKTYTYDAEGTGKIGTYSITWYKIVNSDGANNANSGHNVSIASGKTWHVDGAITLNSNEYWSVNFMFKDVNTNWNNIQNSSVLQGSNTTVGSIKPDRSGGSYTFPPTKTVGNKVYEFTGWCTDEAGNNPVTDDTVITGNQTFYATYKEKVPDTANYTVNYYIEGTTTPVPGITPNPVTGKGNVGDQITIKHPVVTTGYKVAENQPTSLMVKREGTTEVVYYTIDKTQTRDLSYTVEYYKDGIHVEGDDQVVTKSVWSGTNMMPVDVADINVTDKYAGYDFDHSEPTTIPTEIAGGSTIKVYYVTDSTDVRDLSYTVEYYKDGIHVVGDDQVVTKSVWSGTNMMPVDVADINVTDKYAGYDFDHSEPTTIPTEIAGGSTIKVYYTVNSYNYKVSHVYRDADNNVVEELTTTKTDEKRDYLSAIAESPRGPENANGNFVLSNIEVDSVDESTLQADEEGNITGTMPAENLTITFYYDADNIGEKDPEEGDGIADKYQITVTYDAVNGKVVANQGPFVLTKYNANHEYAMDGVAYLAENQIATVEPNLGYHLTGWTPEEPGTEIALNEDTKFVATFAINEYQATVKYIDEETKAEIGTAKEVTVKHGETINGEDYKIDIEDYVYTHAESKAITEAGMIVNVYYSADKNHDEIPDKYQIHVNYNAVNGTITANQGPFTLNKVNENGEYAVDGIAHLSDDQIAKASPNNGYQGGTWSPMAPTTALDLTEDITFTITFTANQTDPDPVNPGCPAGTEWNEEAQACLAPVIPPVPVVPPGPGPVNPEPQPEEEVIVEPTTPEGGGEVTPTPTPEVEEIEEPEQPQVGHKGSWALINLIASLLGLLAALFLIFAKHSKEDDDEEDQNQTVAMNEEEDPEQLKRKRIYKWISGLTAVISVIVFVLTENMRLPMVLVDKWTLLMVVFFLINAVTLYLGRKWHEDEDDEEQTQA